MLEWGMPSKLVVPYNGVILAIGIPEDILKTYYMLNIHNFNKLNVKVYGFYFFSYVFLFFLRLSKCKRKNLSLTSSDLNRRRLTSCDTKRLFGTSADLMRRPHVP